MTLKIAPQFSLPLDVAGEAIAILAKRGAGKTNTATVLVEELVGAGVQVVIVDPVGAWWGIRSSADGKSAGLAVPILGGQHSDVPLEPTAGALIADVVVDSRSSMLLDVTDFATKRDTERFVLDFADRLYRRKARQPSLLHLVLEEADVFAPQSPKGGWGGDAGKMASAIEAIVRRGRSRGIGITMVTQRSAVLNKDVLSQADVLVAMRTTSPHDVAAIEKWVDAHGEDELGVVASLPSLDTGEAWFWNPERDLLERVKVRRRQTFDSSATPKAGEQRVDPKQSAAIDLAALGAKIAETAEKAKANDPAELKKRIRELERDLAARPTEQVTETVEVEKVVEVPVLNGEVEQLEQAATALQGIAGTLEAAAELIGRSGGEISAALDRWQKPAAPVLQRTRQAVAERPAPRAQPRPAPAVDPDGVRLGKGERTVLSILAEYPEGRTHNELAFLAGYSAKASTLGVILANLRRAGLVETGQPIRATDAGLEAAGGVRDRPTGDALLQEWLRHPRMGEGERRVLLTLVEADHDLTHDELCELTGYSPSASTMGVILSKLRKLGLVEKGARRLAPEFREAIEA